MVEISQCWRMGTDSSDRAMGAGNQCIHNKIKNETETFVCRQTHQTASTTFPTHWYFHPLSVHRLSFPCLYFDISDDVLVQRFTWAVDKRDARCLLQPAISCLAWHWVSMILTTWRTHIHYIIRSRMQACRRTHTHRVRRRSPHQRRRSVVIPVVLILDTSLHH